MFIDKQANIADGEGYTRDYLEDSFDEGSHTFIPNLQGEEAFNSFRNQRYDPVSTHSDADFKSLLLREQQGRCCYCMRHIGTDAKDSNIEHVIPKTSPVADFSYYSKYSELLNHRVCHSEVFERRSYPDKKALRRQIKLPHMVAYENLVASCTDPHHCNAKRGSKKVPPLPLISGIEDKYFYSPTGLIVTEDADCEYVKAIDILGLNYETLRLIRLLWRKVTVSSFTVTEILGFTDVKDRQSFLCSVFGKSYFSELSPRWQDFAPYAENGSTYYWDMFVRYDWFYDYYKHHDKNGKGI